MKIGVYHLFNLYYLYNKCGAVMYTTTVCYINSKRLADSVRSLVSDLILVTILA